MYYYINIMHKEMYQTCTMLININWYPINNLHLQLSYPYSGAVN